MDVKRALANQPIRNKLFVSYFSGFVIALLFGSLMIYFFMRTTIRGSIESELKASTTTILNMVRTSATVSLKNYLRAVVEKNGEMVRYLYDQYRQGIISEAEAKRRAEALLLNQKIGKSGYIYCIDSSGVLRVHPKTALRGVNISQYGFAREQKRRKAGYLEYDWRNPGEASERPKALHMTYFAPWDWIISASSYREEFSELVKVDDFRDSILSLRFGETGYSYVINTAGKLIIHPQLEGVNIINETDARGRRFIREICQKRSGKIIYPWRNPGEESPREKLVIFNYIPELDWIVASSGYLEEFYGPLDALRKLMFYGSLLTMFLFFVITLKISSSITTPLLELKEKFDTGATGDFSARMQREANDEIGQLAAFFNSFMAKLETYSTNLKREIQERIQAEQALRASEEMFSKAFRSSPNGIAIIATRSMRFLNVNDSLLRMTGFSQDALIGRSIRTAGLFARKGVFSRLRHNFNPDGHLESTPIDFSTKEGEQRRGLLSAELIELWGEPCILANLEDVTEAHRLEKEIMDISEKERLNIGQDLHDDLCPHLIGIEVLGKVLKRKLAETSVPEWELADKIRLLIKEAIHKTRRLARGLCPVNIDTHGLSASIEDLAGNVTDVFGVDCRFTTAGEVAIQDNTVATHLYYIIHEAVHNAVKHGKAGIVAIDMSRRNGETRLSVTDDGIGIADTASSKGMGLRIMGVRAKKIGADFEIQSTAGGGTVISIRFLNG